jgi:hypothetical protein
MQSENEWETQDMATSQTAKASNGPGKTALAVSRSPNAVQNLPTPSNYRGLVPQTIEDMWRLSQYIVASGLAPQSFKKPEQVFVAIQMGAELGLPPVQSLNSIAVINGRASIWGDASIAMVRRSSVCKSLTSRHEGEGETRVCIVTGIRDNGDKSEQRFGYKDAKRAGLLSRDTYRNYPDRMYFHRAFGYVAHELFPDLLMGMNLAEEQQDIGYEPGEVLQSGDDAPLNSLDDAAELIAADEPRPSGATPEELADMKREQQQERRAHGDKLFETADAYDKIPF